MTKEECEKFQDLEQEAIDSIEHGCWGYNCIEYDNGTYECEGCPCYDRYCKLQDAAIKILNGK